MIQTIKRAFPAGGLALSLFALMILVACSDGATEPAPPQQAAAPTTVPAATAAPAVAPTVAPTPEPEPLTIVTTMSITADWVSNIGGDRVNVVSLLPAGADPHLYQPTPRDVATVAEADLVLPVGLGLEASWLDDLLHTAAADESDVVELAGLIEPLPFEDPHIGEGKSLADAILDVVHEVEDGEISADEGLHEIEELVEAASEEEEHDHAGHAHGEEEDWEHQVLDLIEQAESGQFDAAMAIEEIEHIADASGESMEHEGHGHGDEDEHDHDEDEHDEDEHDEHEDEDEHDDHDHHGHDHGEFDPHFWFDPVRVQVVVTDIAVRLSVLDPAGADTYMANAAAYNAELDEMHHWSEEQLGTIPEDHRLLVTTHEAFGYFAHVYDFKVVGTILPWTTEVEPTPAEIAELSDDIEAYGVSAIFSETTISDRVAKAIADETGISLHSLYSESLAADGEASTYVGMFRANVNTIVEALK